MEQQSQAPLSTEEMVLVVDENNQPFAKMKRKEVRSQNLWHRASYIFLYKPDTNQILVQKRSNLKDYCPGYYDLATGGVVAADESDEVNAQRELQEEVGIALELSQLPVLKRIKYEDSNNCVWGNLFAVHLDRDINDIKKQIQKEEVDDVELWTVNEVYDNIFTGLKITPDGIKAFKEFMELGYLKK